MEILKVIPKSYLSYFLGKLAHVKTPDFLKLPLLNWFANRYNLNLSEASKKLEDYDSIGDLFTRALKDNARIVESEFVSPADGFLRNAGKIPDGGFLEQVKNKDYSIDELLGDRELALKFKDGLFFNIYLSPKDYHRVHFPVSGEITKMIYIPGKLWPVNDWSISNIDRLFCVNERIVTVINSKFGTIALVMVGATNVGRMSMSYDDVITNDIPWMKKSVLKKDYLNNSKKCEIAKHLGTSHLGSTVVMLVSKEILDNVSFDTINFTPRDIKLGNSLI